MSKVLGKDIVEVLMDSVLKRLPCTTRDAAIMKLVKDSLEVMETVGLSEYNVVTGDLQACFEYKGKAYKFSMSSIGTATIVSTWGESNVCIPIMHVHTPGVAIIAENYHRGFREFEDRAKVFQRTRDTEERKMLVHSLNAYKDEVTKYYGPKSRVFEYMFAAA